MKFILIFVSVMFFFAGLNAATLFQPGKIIYTNGDSVTCEIKVYEQNVILTPQLTKKQRVSINGEKTNVDMSEIHYIILDSILYKNELIPFDSVVKRQGKMTKILKQLPCFVKVVVDGKVQLLEYYFTTQNSSLVMNGVPTTGPKVLSSYNFIKIGDTISRVSVTGFKKTMKQLFPTNVSLQEKIKNKTYNYKHLKAIVNDLNK